MLRYIEHKDGTKLLYWELLFKASESFSFENTTRCNRCWKYCIIIRTLNMQDFFLYKRSHRLRIHGLMLYSKYSCYRMVDWWRKSLLVDRAASTAGRKVKCNLLRKEYHWKTITEGGNIGLLVCKHITPLTSKEVIDSGKESPIHMILM